MSLTFKQFLESEEMQINELFGTFRNNKQQQQPKTSKAGADEKEKELEWKIAQQAAKNKRALTPAEKNKIKDKMFADAREKHGDSTNPISVRESKKR